MKTYPLKLITIITEDILENKISEELSVLGAQGYTVTKAHGKGTQRLRASEWEGENIRVEAVVSEETAHRILQHLSDNYFKKYGMLAYISDVQVIRSEKYR